MAMHQVRRLVVAIVALTCACSPQAESDQLVGPGPLTEFSPTGLANIGICGGVFDDVDPSCNGTYAQIGLVAVGPGASQTTVADAIGPWQALLRPGKELGVPQLTSGYGIKTVFVKFPSGSSGDVCGITPVVGHVIDTVQLIPAASCGSIQTGSREVVLRHEVAHVLGWEAQTHGGTAPRNSSITGPSTGRCTTFLHASASNGPIPPNVWPHEVEVINRAYTTGWSSSQIGIYDEEILMRSDASPASLSVAVGGSASISVLHWVSWPSGQSVSRAVTDNGFSAAPSGIASVTDSAVVIGNQSGVGYVWIRADAAPPTGYAMWTPFHLRGDSIPLTVTAPPPVPLQVSDIVVRNAVTGSVVSLPITAPGSYAIDAVVIGTPTWTHIQWKVIDSRAPNDTAFSTTQAPDVRLLFSAYGGDSYNRRFVMTPFSGGTEGFYHIRDIPICVTGGNNPASGTQRTAKSQSVPDAVGGCN